MRHAGIFDQCCDSVPRTLDINAVRKIFSPTRPLKAGSFFPFDNGYRLFECSGNIRFVGQNMRWLRHAGLLPKPCLNFCGIGDRKPALTLHWHTLLSPGLCRRRSCAHELGNLFPAFQNGCRRWFLFGHLVECNSWQRPNSFVTDEWGT
jgi:hypothetical protein